MKRLLGVAGAIVVAAWWLMACGPMVLSPKAPPRARGGILDLTNWDLERDGPVDLAGEWEFYWHRLVQPEDQAERTGFVQLPAPWNNYEVNGSPLSGDGYATYRLEILFDAPPPTPLAFKMPEFETAYVLYVNGEQVGANGVVGTTPETMRPQWLPRVVAPIVGRDSLDVILQISNFYHRKGGAGQGIQFGTEHQIREIRERNLNFEFFLFGSLFIMGLYHMGLFALRRKDLSPLYFGLCCFLMALRTLVTGEYYLVQLVPGIDWELVVRLNYLSFGIVVPVFAGFTRALFPRDVPWWSYRILQFLALAFAVVVVCTPARVFTHALLPYQIVAIVACTYYIGLVIWAAARRRESALIFLVGLLILLVGMTHDILISNQIIHAMYVGPLAIFAFIFIQTLLLARRFSKSFAEAEALSQELEHRVVVRTSELAVRNKQLRDANVDLQREIAERQRVEAALIQARDEAEAANRAKSRFLAHMSHEFRTPLNAILGYSELMAHASNLDLEQQGTLDIINRSGEHLLALINDVLEISKIEAGRTELQEKTFDLHRLLQGLADMFRLRAGEKDLTLVLEQAPDVPRYVWADESKLRQVLINLLSNAVKFTEEGGVTLRVKAQIPNSKSQPSSDLGLAQPAARGVWGLRFEVEDTGVGIAPDELESIFEAFVQAGGEQLAQNGTGLGLTISREFVRLMGGELTASSTMGQGSLFRFDIPIQIADAGAAEARPRRRALGLEPGQRAPDGGPYRLLIVEDDQANRELLRRLLMGFGPPPQGFDVREAINGREALTIWQEWNPHLIWMDLRMPVLDGYEATKRIKAASKAAEHAGPIIVALTAGAFEDEREKTLAEGFDDFARKPFREVDILNVLTRHLQVRFVYGDPRARRQQDGDASRDPETGQETSGA